jgi:hypothetical protein
VPDKGSLSVTGGALNLEYGRVLKPEHGHLSVTGSEIAFNRSVLYAKISFTFGTVYSKLNFGSDKPVFELEIKATPEFVFGSDRPVFEMERKSSFTAKD